LKGGKERGKFEFSVLKSPSQMPENVAFLIYFFKSFPNSGSKLIFISFQQN
jgi:hypothetical protein